MGLGTDPVVELADLRENQEEPRQGLLQGDLLRSESYQGWVRWGFKLKVERAQNHKSQALPRVQSGDDASPRC